jgi:NADPH2 dehydrogenase
MKFLQPIKINNITINNRIAMAPMCMYESDETGEVKSFHHAHYMTRAYGGVGLIIQEATAVESRGRISGRDLGIWSDKHIAGLKTLVDNVHSANAKIAIQLAHAGRKCAAENEMIISSSNIAFNANYKTPKQMTIKDIDNVVNAFKLAAIRAEKAGYDGIEIHGAHGYLINQFLSPLSNFRDDEYGGSLSNRSKFLIRIVEEIRNNFSKAVWVRLSAEEYDEKGHHIEQTLEVLKLIKHNIDGVNVSSGGIIPVVPKVTPGYQLHLAKTIKGAGYLTIGGGLSTTIKQIEDVLNSNEADIVFIGRELLLNPFLIMKELKKLNIDLIPEPYRRG